MRARALLIAAVFSAGLLTTDAHAFFEQTEIGARGVSMGRAFTAVADDASAIYWNPAGLATLGRGSLHFTYHRPFLVPDLSLNFAGVAWPTSFGTVHAAWSHLGLSGAMSEDMFYGGGSRSFELSDTRRLSVGGSVKMARVSWHGSVATASGAPVDLGAESGIAADLAASFRWSRQWSAAWIVRNLGEPTWDFIPGGGGSRLEMSQEAGVSFRWHPESLVAVALVQNADGDLTPMGGTEIAFYDVFAMRAGVGDLQFFGGVGVRAGRVNVDTSFSTHNTLGISSMVSVNVALGSDS